jgi:hypothetical protein
MQVGQERKMRRGRVSLVTVCARKAQMRRKIIRASSREWHHDSQHSSNLGWVVTAGSEFKFLLKFRHHRKARIMCAREHFRPRIGTLVLNITLRLGYRARDRSTGNPSQEVMKWPR